MAPDVCVCCSSEEAPVARLIANWLDGRDLRCVVDIAGRPQTVRGLPVHTTSARRLSGVLVLLRPERRGLYRVVPYSRLTPAHRMGAPVVEVAIRNPGFELAHLRGHEPGPLEAYLVLLELRESTLVAEIEALLAERAAAELGGWLYAPPLELPQARVLKGALQLATRQLRWALDLAPENPRCAVTVDPATVSLGLEELARRAESLPETLPRDSAWRQARPLLERYAALRRCVAWWLDG